MEPVILNETYSGNETVENHTSTFTCVADGFPAPNIVWLLNGFFIPPSSRHMFMKDTVASSYRDHILTAVRSMLTVSRLRLRDSGEYTCRVDPSNIDRGRSDFSSILDLYVEPGNLLQHGMSQRPFLLLCSLQHLLIIARGCHAKMEVNALTRLKATYAHATPQSGKG